MYDILLICLKSVIKEAILRGEREALELEEELRAVEDDESITDTDIPRLKKRVSFHSLVTTHVYLPPASSDHHVSISYSTSNTANQLQGHRLSLQDIFSDTTLQSLSRSNNNETSVHQTFMEVP